MNFCSHCGAPVALRIPPGDSLPRHVCDQCGTIHYQNPKLVIGCIAEWESRILLCKRAIEPRYGRWTLPAGFMENAETTAQAAARETLEEACARVEIGELFALVNVPHINQVHLFYRGTMPEARHDAGEESLETALLLESEIPWEDLAFRSVRFALERYFSDRRSGRFGLHSTDLPPPPPDWTT
ncbi:MAG TPA: NUDIX hydrolase [Azospira sp.]|nr:NUDIX hydrolase [Azospira sp.]